MKQGYIKNPLRGKFCQDKGENYVEKNAYKRRFYLFKYLTFPKYHEYEEYEGLYNKVFEDEDKESIDLQREHLMKGMKLLNQIKDTDEELRNTEILPNEDIEALCKVAANNLFVLMKAQTVPEGKRVKISIDHLANEWLPQVNVEYV